MLEEYLKGLKERGLSDNTIKSYAYSLNLFFSFASKSAESCTSKDVESYAAYLRGDKKATEKTVHRHLNSLRSYFRHIGMSIADEIELPKVHSSPPVFLKKEEISDIIKSPANPRDKCILNILWATGMTVSELSKLNRNDLNEGGLTVSSGKKKRCMPINAELRESIEGYLKGRADSEDPLFLSNRETRISVRTVQWLLKKYSIEAGAKNNVTASIFRHSFAVKMYEEKTDLKIIKEFLGHSQISSTKKYAALNKR